MEAMSMEVPVISTNTVGMPELIDEKITGLLINEKNSKELSKAIEYLLKNKEIALKMGIAGRKKIVEDFNLENTPNHFKKILSS
jgi:glycosyltransferase involved in cell wall biosynthesis